ncbi:hypothetical protein BD310DRAFT_729448 [Dichomitus squalens]|uniref:Uncharacterized protein n=1 Tax=Dichomitus squalens TaxID=114155 RepID=A0A4Q9PKU9_9APHY|nr:hypothetical protein BD310DRAFT_729448 [Dichomitus squalens]
MFASCRLSNLHSGELYMYSTSIRRERQTPTPRIIQVSSPSSFIQALCPFLVCPPHQGSAQPLRHARHRFDYDTPIEETMQAFHDVMKAGYVRYISMSSC